jgi:hypothetical protein
MIGVGCAIFAHRGVKIFVARAKQRCGDGSVHRTAINTTASGRNVRESPILTMRTPTSA